jgi:LuxR family maltose regulon positive regulatory protein
LALHHHHVETIIAQSRRALEYLHPNNLAFRTFTVWKLGYAYHIQGDRAAASRAYTEAISTSQASGNTITTIAAMLGLGHVQETQNQLYLSAETYQRALQLLADQPLPIAFAAHLGLARISYEWNDLQAAERYGQHSIQLARLSENTDRFITCELFLARLKLAQGDVTGAAAILAEADQAALRSKFAHQMPQVAAIKVLTLLRQGDIAAAAQLAQAHNLPSSQARVLLAQGDAPAALAILEPFRRGKRWPKPWPWPSAAA